MLPCQQFHQSSTITELIHKVVIVFGFKHFIVHDNVVSLSNHGKGLYFIHCTLLQLGILMQFLGGNDFNSILLVGFGVFCPVDFTVVALPNDLEERVIVDHFDHEDNKRLIVDLLIYFLN